MADFDLTNEERTLLIRTLVETARADGSSPIERAFIDHVMLLLAVGEAEQEEHRSVLLGHTAGAGMPTLDELPSAAKRLVVYEAAVDLCRADRVLSSAERESMEALAASLHLSADEVSGVWDQSSNA